MDPENEDKLQKAMEELMRNKTIIMIAHRLKTVEHADQILVLDQGRIVQSGTHRELAGRPGLYGNFWMPDGWPPDGSWGRPDSQTD